MNSVTKFDKVDYICGGTLWRLKIIEKGKDGSFTALARPPTQLQLDIHCDTCPVHHSSSNTNCSANWGIQSPASEVGILYTKNFKKTEFVLIHEEIITNSTYYYQHWE